MKNKTTLFTVYSRTFVCSGLPVDEVCDGAGGCVQRYPEVVARVQQLLFPFPVHRLARPHPTSKS